MIPQMIPFKENKYIFPRRDDNPINRPRSSATPATDRRHLQSPHDLSSGKRLKEHAQKEPTLIEHYFSFLIKEKIDER